jgi:hypothetical protein
MRRSTSGGVVSPPLTRCCKNLARGAESPSCSGPRPSTFGTAGVEFTTAFPDHAAQPCGDRAGGVR